jgi:hypothetical protein
MSYNGWKNWATWNLELWIDNEEGIYREKQRILRRHAGEIEPHHVVTFTKTWFPDGTPDMDGKLDREIDFEEIAESWNEESKEYLD